MKYRMELRDGTVLLSEDVVDLCCYLKCIGFLSMSQVFEIVSKISGEGFTQVVGDYFTITEETEEND